MVWEKILKGVTERGHRTGHFDLDEFPELLAILRNDIGRQMKEFPALNRVKAQWEKRPDNTFIPSLVSPETDWAIYNKVNTDTWQVREVDEVNNQPLWGEMHDRKDEFGKPTSSKAARVAAQGERRIQLQPNEIGVSVTQRMDNTFHVWVQVPKDTDWMYVSEGVELTNAEAAILEIVTKFGKGAKDFRPYFTQFGLGELKNVNKHGENPLIMSLVEKGLFTLNLDHENSALRGFPRITHKGRANIPDMSREDFVSKFKSEVLKEPDKPFLFIAGGIDEDDWFTA